MPTFAVKPEFREDIERLVIPQFFAAIPDTLFTDGSHVLLDEAQLSEGFTLKNKDCDIDFAAADDGIVKVDIENKETACPVYSKCPARSSNISRNTSTVCPRKAGYASARK